MTARSRIVIAGSMAGVPGHGGWTWALLQYVLGLKELGHDVCWIDPITTASIQPGGARLTHSRNTRYFQEVTRAFALQDVATLLLQDQPDQTVGAPLGVLQARARQSDLLINVSGALTLDAVLGLATRRVYLDLDPGYTQLWHAVQGIDMGLDAHTDFVTIGPHLMTSDVVPTGGRHWRTTLQPIVLSHWPQTDGGDDAGDAFTTVANWRGYGSITHAGVFYGQKAHSFREYLTLPRLTGERFVLALAIHRDEHRDRQALENNGWCIVDPDAVAARPETYRQFVRGSAAELAIAKSGYVNGPTGWFSDRSICYLASGRPVVAQETGFSRLLPVGRGLLAFSSVDEAAEGVLRVRRDYHAHAAAARRLAEEHFASGLVLRRLLRELEVAA